jgi:alpha,alpha-trehalase
MEKDYHSHIIMKNMDYGVIGNCKSAAIIDNSGSIDWLCLPDFSSSSVFARLLDKEKGGEFRIEPTGFYYRVQSYIEDTNILKTSFVNSDAAFDLIDFMPRYKAEEHYVSPPDLVRLIKIIRGKPEIIVRYNPKLGYAEYESIHTVGPDYIKTHTSNGKYESIYLYSNLPLKTIYESKPVTLKEDIYFLLSYDQKIGSMNYKRVYLDYERTKLYWMNWSAFTLNFSHYAEEISRSALVLKLLTFQKTGAIIAAVTTSLPEVKGKNRNWDYRFCWIRDASMIVSTLYKLGHKKSALRFMDFIVSIIPYKDNTMQIVYNIFGEKNLEEKHLPWFSGYKNSKPVRIGNNAYLQKQHDIFGILLDVIYKYFLFFKHNTYHAEELWTIVRSLVRTVIKDWQEPDMGIWEFRTQKKHNVFSKVLCWVALDRGIKIARLINHISYIKSWDTVRQEIHKDVLSKGWNNELKSFTQSYGDSNIDAANLLMGMYGFIDPGNEKYKSTVRITRDLLCRDGLMYRYNSHDDLGLPESSFTICTFWMIKSLSLIGEKEQAENMFSKLLSYSNHLGLFSEDIDFNTKELLGNFPQGYSHLALIDTAMTLFESELTHEEELLRILNEETKGIVF